MLCYTLLAYSRSRDSARDGLKSIVTYSASQRRAGLGHTTCNKSCYFMWRKENLDGFHPAGARAGRVKSYKENRKKIGSILDLFRTCRILSYPRAPRFSDIWDLRGAWWSQAIFTMRAYPRASSELPTGSPCRAQRARNERAPAHSPLVGNVRRGKLAW